jgi:hypothetical protein
MTTIGSTQRVGSNIFSTYNLEELRHYLKQRLDEMTTEVIANIVRRQSIVEPFALEFYRHDFEQTLDDLDLDVSTKPVVELIPITLVP